GAVRLFARAQHLYPRAVRRRPPQPRPRRHDRDGMPRPYPAGAEGSRRAAYARREAGPASASLRRDAVADPRRRPSSLPSSGHRSAAQGGRRDVAAGRITKMPLSIPASALVAAVVGFGGTLALIIAAADAVAATPAQTASWVTAICL